MSTDTIGGRAFGGAHAHISLLASHWTWLAIGFVVAFGTPFLLTDVLDLNRDVFYGMYALAVAGLFTGWVRSTGYDLAAAVRRRWLLAIGLGTVCGGLLAMMVVRTEAATARPDGIKLVGALAWRGVLYGVTDGLLLSAFPILAVFAAFSGRTLMKRRRGKIAVGAIALIASLALTAVYHAGYSDFRSSKLTKPITGDAIWSAADVADAEPDRCAYCPRWASCFGGASQLPDRHVPATAQVNSVGKPGYRCGERHRTAATVHR